MNHWQRVAALVLCSWLVIALAAIVWPPAANEIELGAILERPSADALAGRDDLGRSQLARLIVGARLSLGIAVIVVTLTTLVGLCIGVIAGWCGGLIDLLLVRLIDIVLAFPGILLAMALAGVLGPGIGNVVLALTAVGWASVARLVRAQTQSLRQRDHVAVAEALGVGAARTVLRHIVPLLLGPLVVEMTFAAAAVIVAEAGLSFLGLGVQPPTPSWGSMIRDGTRYLLVAPHVVLVPGLALASVVVSINLLGDHLRDRWQPPRR